jgi:hypothetical protein
MSEQGSFLELSHQDIKDAIIMWLEESKPVKSEIADLICLLKRNLDYEPNRQQDEPKK